MTDAELLSILKNNPNMAVPYYLMSSYLYYEENESLVSDDMYDKLCKFLYVAFDKINHVHKHLVDKESLASGTGYYLNKKMPNMVMNAAKSLMEKT